MRYMSIIANLSVRVFEKHKAIKFLASETSLFWAELCRKLLSYLLVGQFLLVHEWQGYKGGHMQSENTESVKKHHY